LAGVSPGIARIAVIVALVVGGVGVLASGFGTSTTSTAGPVPHLSPSPSSGSEPSTSKTPAPHKTGVKIVVLNGTSATGIAAQVQQMLLSKGYVKARDAANSPVTPITKTQIYYRGGANAAQDRSDAEYLARKFFKGASVSQLDPTYADVTKGAEVAIVLGADYANGAA
jgi:hypothetical protein